MSDLDSNMIGKGSYGRVRKVAMKEFEKLSILVQEFMCMKYMSDCKYVHVAMDANLKNQTITNELYDTSLERCLHKLTNDEKIKLSVCMLKGLVEIHDRDLVHADLKPGNMFVKGKGDSIHLCIADLGFCSISGYAKMNFITEAYGDEKLIADQKSDLYSLGICLAELFSGVQKSIKTMLSKISDSRVREVIEKLVSKDRDARPTARAVLLKLHNIDPKRWKVRNDIYTRMYDVIEIPGLKEYIKTIKITHKRTKTVRSLPRSFKIYQAISDFLFRKKIFNHYQEYALMACFIGCSLFSESFSNVVCNKQNINLEIVDELMNDDFFVAMMFFPSNNASIDYLLTKYSSKILRLLFLAFQSPSLLLKQNVKVPKDSRRRFCKVRLNHSMFQRYDKVRLY